MGNAQASSDAPAEALAEPAIVGCPVHGGEPAPAAPVALPHEHAPATCLTEALAFYRQLEVEFPWVYDLDRWRTVASEIASDATYEHTSEELVLGARLAWRNNTRCIGRLHWQTLEVLDRRDAQSAEEVFDACVEHLRHATNGGRLRPLLTVFAPRRPDADGPRIWNGQLIRYAGYRQPDGSVIGDPLNADLTEAVRALGWPGGAGTPFDLLPLVVQMPDEKPRWFDLPPDAVLEVPLSHPTIEAVAEQGWKWHAVPAISDMCLEIGGVEYTAAPFNGWYVSFEIGARNLSDRARYDLLPAMARLMGLDTRSDRTLWKDRALVELNVAVVHSFAAAGVSIVDHHAVARQFMAHQRREQAQGREVPAEWSWIVPPISGSTTPVFHQTYPNTTERPNYFYQAAPWGQVDG